MNIACIGDLHIRSSAPIARKDNFEDTLFNKLEYVFEKSKEKKCKYLLQPGDHFHSTRTSHETISRLIKLYKKYEEIKVICIAGQHDLKSHVNDISNTPINILKAAGVITFVENNYPLILDNISIYGCSFGEEIPIPKSKRNNILLIHAMIIKDEKIWYGQEEYIKTRSLLKKNFDLIVSGDNHQAFFDNHNGKQLFNGGSLGRMKSNQYNHKPLMGIYNPDNNTLEINDILLEKPENVFDIDYIKRYNENKESKKNIEEYMNDFEIDFDESVIDYRKRIDYFFSVNDVDKMVKELIYKSMD